MTAGMSDREGASSGRRAVPFAPGSGSRGGWVSSFFSPPPGPTRFEPPRALSEGA